MPGLVDRLLFSTISVGGCGYIAGMRVIFANGKAMELGYRAKEEEFLLHGSELLGMKLAIGSRGIHGIRCILENSQESGWFRCSQQAAKTERLVGCGRIIALEADFDVCIFNKTTRSNFSNLDMQGFKMVSLAAAWSSPSDNETRDEKIGRASCRERV